MFNEFESKDYSKQIQLTLKRSEEGVLSPWQISNLIVKMSSNYYKSELLNTISLAINEGINPKDIFIMDDSFQINNSYTYVDIFNLSKIEDVKNLYHLGFPTPIFPNEKLLKIKLCFMFFRNIYTLLNSKKLEKPDKNKLYQIVENALVSEDITPALDKIKEIAIDIINTPRYEKIDEKEMVRKVDDYYNKRLRTYKKFKADEISIDNLSEEVEKGRLSLKNLPKEKRNLINIENDYFNKFFSIFKDLKRPIVGIFYPETNQVQIICKNFINKNERDSKFVDIKQIRHNSPYLICMLIGIGVGAPLLKMFKSIKDDRTLEENEQRLIEEDEDSQRELEEAFRIISEINEEPENQAINDVENTYLRDKLKDVQQTNNLKFNEPITQYNFNNTNIEIKVIHQPPNNPYK